jgi:glycogen(starch) synthase
MTIIKMAGSRTLDVALVGSYPPPHGGQSVHILNLAKYLRARGLEVGIFNTGLNKNLRENGVVNVTNSRSLLIRLLSRSNFNLLHVHVSSVDDFGKLVPVRLAAAVKRLPWVVTIHSGSTVNLLRRASWLRRCMWRALLSSAKKVICVNDAIRDEISMLVGTEMVVVIPAFSVDFSSLPPSAELESFLADHSPAISCVGLYESAYGFDQAVHLIARIREVYPAAGLLLIGDIKNSEWCRNLIKDLQLENHVRLCGNLGQQECLSVMNRSALFLRPTLYDGDSISVREALALEVPVVASETDFRPDGVILYRIGVFEDLVSRALQSLDNRSKGASRSVSDQRNLEQVRELYLTTMRGPVFHGAD